MAYLYQNVIQDFKGNIINGAIVSVYDTGTTTLATLYADEDETTTIDNPLTSNSNGQSLFYVAAGLYDIKAS